MTGPFRIYFRVGMFLGHTSMAVGFKGYSPFWFLVIFTLMSGCGDNNTGPVYRDVSGTVTSRNAPVKQGLINFEEPSTGYADSAEIINGAYQIRLADGTYQIWVTPPLDVVKTADGGDHYKYAKVDDIPGKYRLSDSSGFSATVTSESVVHHFQMK